MERVVGQAAASVRSTAARTAMVVEVGDVRVESAHAHTANSCSSSDSDSDSSSVRETLTHPNHTPSPGGQLRL
jgi:hypothetical protein